MGPRPRGAIGGAKGTPRRRTRRGIATACCLLAGTLLAGCGRTFVVLNPVGPVARRELDVMLVAAVAMGAVIVAVIGLFVYALVRFADRPGNPAPFRPEWAGSRRLEIILFAVPLLIVTIISVPVLRQTFSLQRLPLGGRPMIIDVTSLDWKWLFEYPAAGIAATNRLEVPTGVPLLFELTADSPMNSFWIPQLGGMEYAMPGRVLPLWLEVDKAGTYQGRSANFSGKGFVDMAFTVDAVPPGAFAAWVQGVRGTAPAMTMTTYRALLQFDSVPPATYSSYPAATFPATTHGFTLKGGLYTPATLPG